MPPSKLPDLVYQTKEDLEKHGILYTIIGHVGDGMSLKLCAKPRVTDMRTGNFHTALVFREDHEVDAIHGAVDRMVKRAIALDGTCTGEHGVGIGKKAYLYDELGEGTVELMKTVKRALDPHNLFNPGKVSSTAVDGCVCGGMLTSGYAQSAVSGPPEVREGSLNTVVVSG